MIGRKLYTVVRVLNTYDDFPFQCHVITVAGLALLSWVRKAHQVHERNCVKTSEHRQQDRDSRGKGNR